MHLNVWQKCLYYFNVAKETSIHSPPSFECAFVASQPDLAAIFPLYFPNKFLIFPFHLFSTIKILYETHTQRQRLIESTKYEWILMRRNELPKEHWTLAENSVSFVSVLCFER